MKKILMALIPLMLSFQIVSGLNFTQFVYDCGGADGAITRSVDATETDIIEATTYVVNTGIVVTTTVNNRLVICATDSITINGTINVNALGRVGGVDGANPTNGSSGCGTGGSAAQANAVAVGGGRANIEERLFIMQSFGTANSFFGSGGGGGRLAGALDSVGGGGGGGCWRSGGNGGDDAAVLGTQGAGSVGGRGGGGIVLIAPTITLGASSRLTSRGENATAATFDSGAGAGGAGGIILTVSETLIEESGRTVDNTGGNGGGCHSGTPGTGGAAEIMGGSAVTGPDGGGCGGGGSGGKYIRRTGNGGDVDDEAHLLTHGTDIGSTSTVNILVILLIVLLGIWVWKMPDLVFMVTGGTIVLFAFFLALSFRNDWEFGNIFALTIGLFAGYLFAKGGFDELKRKKQSGDIRETER